MRPASVCSIETTPSLVGQQRRALGLARLEELLDARQTGGDVGAVDAAGVEGPHRQLGARLADRLGGDDADRLAVLDQPAGRQVAPVAEDGRRRGWPRRPSPSGGGSSRPRLAITSPTRSRTVPSSSSSRSLSSSPRSNRISPVAGSTTGEARMRPVTLPRNSSSGIGLPSTSARSTQSPCSVPQSSIVMITSCDDIDQAAGKVAGVGCPQRGVGQPLAGAVGGEEVLQHGQPFAEVGADRDVDDPPLRVEHETAHTRHLADLVHVPLRAGVRHHVDGVLAAQAVLDVLRQHVAGRVPNHFELAQPLFLGDQTASVLPLDLVGLLVRPVQQTRPSSPTWRRRRRRSTCRRGSRTRSRPS